MTTKALRKACLLASLAIVALVPAPISAQACGPDVDGRVAAVAYRDTSIVWDPVVEYERMILTVGGPCEDIVRVFDRGEPIFFDLREIERVGDGVYTWELRREATVSPATKKALAESRKSGDDGIWWSLFQQGAIPQGPYVDSESFTVADGVIVPPGQIEGKSQPLAAKPQRTTAPGGHPFGFKDQVIPDDLVVQGSTCVGFDCVNNVTFSDSTILMMENNTRIKFDDTSTLAGFPANDWEIQANSGDSGGGSYLAINDCANSSQGGCAEDPLFKVEAGARANALYVESDGDVGIGTANPVLDLHIVNGDTPAVRLDQNSSGGFTAQVWDVAGNEASFFVRDVTGGSRLPFRIRPGAPTSSIDISVDGDVGIGTASPTGGLHVSRSTGSAAALVKMSNNSGIQLYFDRTDAAANDWQMSNFSNSVQISIPGSALAVFTMDSNGNMTIGGTNYNTGSSRDLKENFVPVDGRQILQRLVDMPLTEWNAKADPNERHIGPIAEEWWSTFGLGPDDKHVSTTDVGGVALAAIKGLHQVVAEKDAAIAQLQQTVNGLEVRNSELAARLAAIEEKLESRSE